MASSGPNRSAGDAWLRWVWIPIVVPGLVLGWLAWRAIGVEQSMLRRQVVESRQRLAYQVAGNLSGAGREVRNQAQLQLERWVMDVGMGLAQVPPPWFDAVEIRGEQWSKQKLSGSIDSSRLEAMYQGFWEPAQTPDERLSRLEDWILVALHAPDHVLPLDLDRRLDTIRKGIATDVSTRPQWKALLFDQLEAMQRRAVQVQVRKDASGVFDSLAKKPITHLVDVAGRTWLVLAPPDLPRGVVAVGRFSERALQERLLNVELVPASKSSGPESELFLGMKNASGQILGLEGEPPASAPDELVAVPGGFPSWSVAVWSLRQHESATRFRTVFVSALLGLSLIVLVGATAAASRSIRVQRDLLTMKTDFIGNISHELKTPLTSIALYAELLAGGRGAERSGEFGATILREARRLQGLIEGLLSFARDEADHSAKLREPLRLDVLAREAGASFDAVSHRRNIEWRIETEPVTVVGDKSLLRPVIDNLVDNAFKYGKPGGKVHLEVRRKGQWAILRVIDDGPGIPEEDHPRVFERFFRGGGELTRTVSGTGLGLAIVKRNVEFHGGEVILESRERNGTIFEIRLPAVEETDA